MWRYLSPFACSKTFTAPNGIQKMRLPTPIAKHLEATNWRTSIETLSHGYRVIIFKAIGIRKYVKTESRPCRWTATNANANMTKAKKADFYGNIERRREVDSPFMICMQVQCWSLVNAAAWFWFGLEVTHHACSNPSIRVVALIPVNTSLISWGQRRWLGLLQGLASSYAGVRCPGATKDNIVFSVKEIGYVILAVITWDLCIGLTSVSRVEFHRLESFMFCKWRAGPFPESAHVSLAREFVAVGSNGNRMPTFEANVCTPEVGEKLLRASTGL